MSDVLRSVVITGGGGLLAGALAGLLRQRGIACQALTRSQADITNPADIKRLFQAQPTLLLNCAADAKVDRCEREAELAMAVNARAPGQLATQAAQHGAKLVHFSTDFVFDGLDARPYCPGHATNPLSLYGKSKLAGERAIQAVAGDQWLIVRTSGLFGTGGYCFPGAVVERARSGDELHVVADQVTCPTYAPGLAAITLALVEKGAAGIFHVAGQPPTTWYEFAKACLEVFRIKIPVTPVTTQQWREIRRHQAERPAYSVLDCSATERIVGRPMPHWREGLLDYRRAAESGGS